LEDDSTLDRRAFLEVLTGGLLAAPLVAPFAAEAQTPGRVVKLGILSTVNPRTTTFTEAMIQRLRELGYVEGARTLSSSSGTPKAMLRGFPLSPSSSSV
jgi:hypothetical protein